MQREEGCGRGKSTRQIITQTLINWGKCQNKMTMVLGKHKTKETGRDGGLKEV